MTTATQATQTAKARMFDPIALAVTDAQEAVAAAVEDLQRSEAARDERERALRRMRATADRAAARSIAEGLNEASGREDNADQRAYGLGQQLKRAQIAVEQRQAALEAAQQALAKAERAALERDLEAERTRLAKEREVLDSAFEDALAQLRHLCARARRHNEAATDLALREAEADMFVDDAGPHAYVPGSRSYHPLLLARERAAEEHLLCLPGGWAVIEEAEALGEDALFAVRYVPDLVNITSTPDE